jgi:hypothetical protein
MSIKNFKNPWSEGVEFSRNNALKNNVLGIDSFFQEKAPLPDIEFEFNSNSDNSNDIFGLSTAAQNLGSTYLIMEYYYRFESGDSGFFFSPNRFLKSATAKPKNFKNWDDWDNLSSNQRKTLSSLAGFEEDTSDVVRKDTHLNILKLAYKELWDERLFSVFWQTADFAGVWTCNIFVGDAIYLWNKKAILNSRRHYYGPKDIFNGLKEFKKIDAKDVSPGCVVVFGSTHVEIITEMKKYSYADTGFCSIGAGRGSRDETGMVKCDTSLTIFGRRELEDPNNSYYHVV